MLKFIIRKHDGIALLAALILISVVGMMGASVLIATSTEISISGNYRRGIEAFYLAETGIEEARSRLKGPSLGKLGFIGDSQVDSNPQWSAFLLTSTKWKPTDDDSYRDEFTNYIPTPSLPTNTEIVANSFQSEWPYWVKIRHKREYDAKRNGHRLGNPHYLDQDGNLNSPTRANPGNVIFYGYPSPDSIRPTEFTTTGEAQGFPIELLTAHATLKGGSSVIEVEVAHHPGPRDLATLYAQNGVSLTGMSMTISGVDSCGMKPSKPPVYTRTPSTTHGKGVFEGSPSGPAQGPLDIDLPLMVEALRKGALELKADPTNVTLGSSTEPETVYAKVTSDLSLGMFILQNSTGFGIVLVEGDFQIRGPFNWVGLLINTGTLTFDGATGPIHISGGVLSNQVQHVGGEVAIHYDSCAIKISLLSRPLMVRNWRQKL